MILSNLEIIECLKNKLFTITPQPPIDASKAPYNTSAIDLSLGDEIVVPNSDSPIQIDLKKGGIAAFLSKHSKPHNISEDQPFSLKKGIFVLGKTYESVDFPLDVGPPCYCARVEGRSSFARCGLLIHFTAPTIHCGFKGTITLELINFGPNPILLYPKLPICQLIIEQVSERPYESANQFSGQSSAVGLPSAPSQKK